MVEPGQLVLGSFEGLGEPIRIAEGVPQSFDTLEIGSLSPIGPADGVERRLNRGYRLGVVAEKAGEVFDLPLERAASFDLSDLPEVLAQLVGQRKALAEGVTRLEFDCRAVDGAAAGISLQPLV